MFKSCIVKLLFFIFIFFKIKFFDWLITILEDEPETKV
jgi:hypothetical protein